MSSLVLVGQIGCGQALEGHPEGNVVRDPSPQAEVERLLLKRPIEGGLAGEAVCDLDTPLERPSMWQHLADDPPLECRLGVDLLAGP